jgi:hypothetical protein
VGIVTRWLTYDAGGGTAIDRAMIGVEIDGGKMRIDLVRLENRNRRRCFLTRRD